MRAKWMRVWTFCRALLFSPRVALVLLILMTITVTVGSVIPQVSRFGPLEYEQWRAEHQALAAFTEATGLNQVFSSLWFWALSLAMAVSLLCVNGRRVYRLSRRRQRRAFPAFAGFTHEAVFDAEVSVAAAGEAAERTLSRRGYRLFDHGESGNDVDVSGEKGGLGRWGSIVFHLSLLVVFAGGVVAATGGPGGLMVVTEGQTVYDSPNNYLVLPEKPWSSGFSNIGLKFDRLSLNYDKGRTLTDLAAQFSVLREGTKSVGTVRVNEPLFEGGKAFIFQRYGFAPLFVVRDEQGRELFHAYVNLMVSRNEDRDSFEVASIPLFVTVRMYPDGVIDGSNVVGDNQSMAPRRPVVDVRVVDDGREVFSGPVPLDGEGRWPGGSFSFAGLRYWALFRVKEFPGEVVLFAGFLLGVFGLALRLGLVEKRVAVRIVPQGRGVSIRVGGRAEQFDRLYDEKFGDLVAALVHEVEIGGNRSAVLLEHRSPVRS